jgi:hypothetical protein
VHRSWETSVRPLRSSWRLRVRRTIRWCRAAESDGRLRAARGRRADTSSPVRPARSRNA